MHINWVDDPTALNLQFLNNEGCSQMAIEKNRLTLQTVWMG